MISIIKIDIVSEILKESVDNIYNLLQQNKKVYHKK